MPVRRRIQTDTRHPARRVVTKNLAHFIRHRVSRRPFSPHGRDHRRLRGRCTLRFLCPNPRRGPTGQDLTPALRAGQFVVAPNLRRYTAGMSSRKATLLLSLAVAALLGHTALAAQETSSPQADTTPAAQRDVGAIAVAAARYVDRDQLMRDVDTLAAPAFEGRRTGTPGALKARQWLVDQFDTIGLSPAGTEKYLHPFTFRDGGSNGATGGGRPAGRDYSAANVIGHLAGRDSGTRTLVVTAHYDHLGIRDGVLYPGADDNASGVAVLLAAARYLVRNPPRHTVIFAALDAEELGLRGARALLDSSLLSPTAVALHINLDMVGRGGRNEIYAAGTSHTPWLKPLLEDVQTRASVRILFGHDQPMDPTGLEDWTHASDHGPFHDAGIPFVYFGVENHRDYHTASDTPGRIDPRFFGDTADMIVDALRESDARVE
jgi:hypothetical protein